MNVVDARRPEEWPRYGSAMSKLRPYASFRITP